MFIANDSNYTFGQYLDRETVDIKAPVYTKCFTDTEELKGYRFVHDPEETNPEKCVSFSIYNADSSAALAMPFGKFAAVSDLTSVMFRLDTEFVESVLRNVPFYHVIVPVENIADGTLKYLVIMLTKEVEIFPENYPYYELADTFADAQPTSAEAPSGGGGEGGGGDDRNPLYPLVNITFSVNPSDVEDDYNGFTLMFTDVESPSVINGYEIMRTDPESDYELVTDNVQKGALAGTSEIFTFGILPGKSLYMMGRTLGSSLVPYITAISGNYTYETINDVQLIKISGDCSITVDGINR